MKIRARSLDNDLIQTSGTVGALTEEMDSGMWGSFFNLEAKYGWGRIPTQAVGLTSPALTLSVQALGKVCLSLHCVSPSFLHPVSRTLPSTQTQRTCRRSRGFGSGVGGFIIPSSHLGMRHLLQTTLGWGGVQHWSDELISQGLLGVHAPFWFCVWSFHLFPPL